MCVCVCVCVTLCFNIHTSEQVYSDNRQIRFISQIRSERLSAALLFVSDQIGFLCSDNTYQSAQVAVVTTKMSVTIYAGGTVLQCGSLKHGDPSPHSPSKIDLTLI